MYNQDLPRVSLQRRRQVLLTNLQLCTDLIKTMHAVEIFGQRLVINELLVVFVVKDHRGATPAMHRGCVVSPVIPTLSGLVVMMMMLLGNRRRVIAHTRRIGTIRPRARSPGRRARRRL